MRFGTAVARGTICLALIVLACSDDDDGGDPTCNSGYVLKGGVCVKPSDNTSGAGTTAGTTSTTGAEQNGGSTTTDAGTSAGGALGGAGGDTDAGGMAGTGLVAPEVLPTRWLAFSHEKGVFAYDTTKFPDKDVLTPLSEKVQAAAAQRLAWPPNGRTLLYLDEADVYARDLSGDAPDSPKLLLSSLPAPAVQLGAVLPWSWSADSSSVAVVTDTTLSVLDPTQAAPTLHPLTTKLKSFSWAPYGGRLLFSDDTGSYVVQVLQGKPSKPVEVDASATVWSPNGAQLAGVKDGDLALTSLSGDEVSLELLTNAQASNDPPPALDPEYIRFNKRGSVLTFSGQLAADEAFNGYTLSLEPRGEPVAVPSDAPDAETSCSSWSPDGRWLLCAYDVAAGSQWFAVDTVAQESTNLLEAGNYGSWGWSPEPSRYQLFTSSVDGTSQIAMVDLDKPDALVPIFDGPAAFSVSPAGTLLSYVSKPTIHLVNLAEPEKTPFGIPTAASASDPPVWAWSPNSQFIAIADGSHQQRLAKIDGAETSTPVTLQGLSASAIDFAWQP